MKRLAFALALVAAGCGKSEPPSPVPPPTSDAPPSPPAPPATTDPPKTTKPPEPKPATSLTDEERADLIEQLEKLGNDPKSAEKRRRIEERLGLAPEPPRPLVPRPPAPPEPRMYVTVNGTDVPRVPAGWPMVIELTVHAPGGGALKLEAPSGNWGDLVRVEFPEGWNPKPIVQASGALSLDAATSGRLAWTVSPEDSAALPPGVVEVRATLVSDGPTWKGRLLGRARVTIAPASRRDSLEGVSATVRYLLAIKDAEGALKEVDAMLKRQVAHPLLLMLRADVLVQLGRKEEALQALDEGIQSAIKYKMPTGGLVARRRLIEESK